MKILLLSWRDPKHPFAGGAEQVMHEHAKGWIEKGHSVTLFSSLFPGALTSEILDGVKIIRGGNQILGVHFKAFAWYLFAKEKFDLVIDQFHGIPFFTPLYVRTKKLAVLQEVAREVWFLNDLPKPFNWIVGFLGYWSEPFVFWIYRSTDFITGSVSAKKDIVDFGISEDRVTVIPHGVIIEKSKTKLKKDFRPTLIFLGALTKDKGIEDALKSFYLLSQRDKKYQFWIVGKGEKSYVESLFKLVKKYEIGENTKFFGYVSQKKKFELLGRARLLINPSVREGWGLVNIEANAMRTPIIAYNSVGLTDSVKNGFSGIICRENTPEELANNVEAVLKNKASYEVLSKQSLEWSNDFSWAKSRKMSNKLICEITGLC